jgi:uncharacterized LabA/DUF88 family protein
VPLALHALIDFFNVGSLRRGAQLTYGDYRDALDRIVSIVLGALPQLDPRPDEVSGRIYGGWFYDQPPRSTQARDMLGDAVRRGFPTRRKTRFRMAMADSLVVLPDIVLPATLRMSSGIPNLMITTKVANCASPHTCRANDLRDWIRGRCPHSGCPVESTSVCKQLKQKLVDAAICCDTISLSETRHRDWIMVVSNDDDLVPGILMASRQAKRLVRLRQSDRATRFYDRLLRDHRVELLEV